MLISLEQFFSKVTDFRPDYWASNSGSTVNLFFTFNLVFTRLPMIFLLQA